MVVFLFPGFLKHVMCREEAPKLVYIISRRVRVNKDLHIYIQDSRHIFLNVCMYCIAKMGSMRIKCRQDRDVLLLLLHYTGCPIIFAVRTYMKRKEK